MDWTLLYAKQVPPPYTPTLAGPDDTRYIDAVFLSEDPHASVSHEEHTAAHVDQTLFDEFSFEEVRSPRTQRRTQAHRGERRRSKAHKVSPSKRRHTAHGDRPEHMFPLATLDEVGSEVEASGGRTQLPKKADKGAKPRGHTKSKSLAVSPHLRTSHAPTKDDGRGFAHSEQAADVKRRQQRIEAATSRNTSPSSSKPSKDNCVVS